MDRDQSKTEIFLSRIKKRLPAVIIGAILAIVLELALSGYAVNRGRGSNTRTVIADADASYYPEENITRVIIENCPDLGRLEITFAEPLAYDVQIDLYYADSNSDKKYSFDYYRRKEGYLLNGTTEAALNIPAGLWDRLRIDIYGNFVIADIVGVEPVPLSAITPEMILQRVSWLRLIVFLFLGMAGGFFFSGRRSDTSVPKDRTAYLDALRILAVIFVILIHSEGNWGVQLPAGTPGYNKYQIYSIIVFTCNPLFIMVSGALILPWREESIGTYVKKRMTSVIIPLLIYSLIYICGTCVSICDIPYMIKNMVRIWLSGSYVTAGHLWLIYEIIGLYIVALPLRYMLKNMPENIEKMLACLIVILMGIRAVNVWNGTVIFGISTFLSSWTGIFIMGYLLTRNWMRKYDGFIICAGIAAFALSAMIATTVADYSDLLLNCTIFSLLMSSLIFVAAKHAEKLLEHISGLLAVISKYSYSVILVHFFVLNHIICAGFLTSYIPQTTLMVTTFLLCLVISFILAVLIDKLVVNVILDTISGKAFKKSEHQICLS